MTREMSGKRSEENYKRIRDGFTDIPDEALRKLYSSCCARLEHEAAIIDFIPILAEKMVRNHLRNNTVH